MVTTGCDDVITYVAEYLQRIGSISLTISFPKSHVPDFLEFPDTSANFITLHYHMDDDDDDEVKSLNQKIKLPVEFGAQFVGKTIKLERRQTAQFSIKTTPMEDLQNRFNDFSSFLNDNQISVPWSTLKLSKADNQNSVFQCSNCKSDLVNLKAISQWKSLPSETWAEMMDFWHCHKPADNPSHEHSHTHLENSNHEPHSPPSFNPSYAVSSFHASESTALVGLTYILFHPSHLVSESYEKVDNSDKNPLVCCSKCNSWIGNFESDDTLKMFKYSMSLVNGQQLVTSYSNYYYLSATLEELISSHALYTFSIVDESYCKDSKKIIKSDKEELLLWAFNPDIQFCTNQTEENTTDRGIKVFYSTDPALIPKLKLSRGDVEQVFLPREIIDDVLAHLRFNNGLYLEKDQKMGNGWNVSILGKLR